MVTASLASQEQPLSAPTWLVCLLPPSMDSLFFQAITQYLLNSSCRLGSTIGPQNKEVTQCMDPACKLSAFQWEEEGGSQTSKAEHSPQAAS